jgi:hypothetical protein
MFAMQLITFLYELVDTFGALTDGYPLLIRPEADGCRIYSGQVVSS